MSTTVNPELDLTMSRVIKAPRQAVWDAWTDRASFEQWWIPQPMECKAVKLDLRPGGGFETLMREVARTPVVVLTPQGKPYTQRDAERLGLRVAVAGIHLLEPQVVGQLHPRVEGAARAGLERRLSGAARRPPYRGSSPRCPSRRRARSSRRRRQRAAPERRTTHSPG